ncbi:uncharacterized protein AFUA_5G06905 [Aspergillus fumigatus Af293]|uniref:Uncharacterized protein n=1 Tax=Aspergillus fumigatus (strain ATCC MYA-4609 / CBS 101355 / FGSC A1100 / Af293) TaxID=330879 RepID=A4D9J0_ASPFU|nr:conserved hypothetical protein [Aspergillus fumigatus Af293]EBA27445.1 conserved hypothetical protein [Aspergillus fumigatus Af293]
MDDKVITKICERIPNQVYFWAVDYAIGDIKTVDARLSANEKQSIIAALDGYCKQEDWEPLIQRFPADARKKVLQLFAQTLWTKHLFEDVFLKPFLYFDFYEQEEMTSTAGKPDISLPTKLQNMYHMFRTVDKGQAELWRSDTVRLANSIVPLNEEVNWDGHTTILGSAQLVLGERSKQARRSAVERLVSNILDGPMRLMLRKLSSPKEVDQRSKIMVDVYCRMAELATRCWAERQRWDIRGLDKVDRFHWVSETLDLHFLQMATKDDPKFDGKAVLVVVQPLLYLCGGLDLQFNYDRMIAKGLAIVEDPDST